MKRKLDTYYYGTYTDWNNDGNEDVFAVATADEIPASAKDVSRLQAYDQQDAEAGARQIFRDRYETTYRVSDY